MIHLITNAGMTALGAEMIQHPETKEKVLVGIVTKENLSTDPEFGKWYAEEAAAYETPDTAAVQALKENSDAVYFIGFIATWCEDTQHVLPRFFKIQEAAGFPENRTVLFALDHNKKMKTPIAEAMNVTHTPTIIVMKDGKEAGRVVELGTNGHWESELAEIVGK